MRFKDLFTVPTGQKVTEKHLRRVLISSICSILLCMSCLVSATWAWFAVSIENTGNEIWIGEPKVNLTVDGQEYISGNELSGTDIALHMVNASKTDDFNKKSTLYVTLTIRSDSGTITVYETLDESNDYSATISIKNNTGKPFSFSWIASWFTPAKATELTQNTINLAAEDSTPPSSQATTDASTESSTEASTDATTDTGATEPSDQPTSEATEPKTTTSAEETTDTTEGES